MLAGFDQLLGLAQGRSVNGNDVLLFGSGIEEVAGHREGILPFRNSPPLCRRPNHLSDIPTIRPRACDE